MKRHFDKKQVIDFLRHLCSKESGIYSITIFQHSRVYFGQFGQKSQKEQGQLMNQPKKIASSLNPNQQIHDFNSSRIYQSSVSKKVYPDIYHNFQIMSLKSSIFMMILLVSMLVGLINTQQTDPTYTFEDFLQQCNKTYDDPEEYNRRKQIFQENYAEIKKLQVESDDDVQYEINCRGDLTIDEQQKYMGLSNSLGRPSSPLPTRLRSSSGKLSYPSSLDYRLLGKVTPVKNQQSCGSCWAFSTVGMYESNLAIENDELSNLSEQYVLDCTSTGDCDGGYPEDAVQMIVSGGVPLQSTFPYQNWDNILTPSQCNTGDKVKLNAQILNTPHYSNLDDAELKQILHEYGPVSVGLYANFAFDYYSSGIFTGCPSYVSQYSINHAVLLVGYTAEGHWIIKNSWGENWGQNGYITISKNRNCGLTKYVDVIQVDWPEDEDENEDNEQDENEENQDEDEEEQDEFHQYTVQLSDKWGDGWNGNIIGIRQNGVITSSFGSSFTSGASYGPVTVNVKKNVHAELVVVQIGFYRSEVGFNLYNQNGSLVYTKCYGFYQSNIIFHQWCPGSSCIQGQQQMYELHISMTDSYGNGWNDNVLAFKQDGLILGQFGQTFTEGHENGPVVLSVPFGIETHIVVKQLGTWRRQIGFIIRDSYQNTIFERQGGTNFHADSILGKFCPGCNNQANVQGAGTEERRREDSETRDIPTEPEEPQKQTKEPTSEAIVEKMDALPFIVTTGIFSFFTILFLVTTIILFVLWKNERKHFGKFHQENSQLIRIPQHHHSDHDHDHHPDHDENEIKLGNKRKRKVSEATTYQLNNHDHQ